MARNSRQIPRGGFRALAGWWDAIIGFRMGPWWSGREESEL